MVISLLAALLAGFMLALAFPLSLPPLPVLEQAGYSVLPLPGAALSGDYSQLPWLAFLALVPLMEIARRSEKSTHALCWGIVAGITWISAHLLWLSSFDVLPVALMTFYMSLHVGLFTWLAHLIIRNCNTAAIAWGLPGLWVAIEYVRSFGFWAFPWNLLGYSQVENTALIQVADIGGVYMVSFLIALVNTAVFLLFGNLLPRPRLRLAHVLLAGAVAAGALAYGEYRLLEDPPDPKEEAPLRIALVQGGLSTRERWEDDRLQHALDAYVPPTDQAYMDWMLYLDDQQTARHGQYGPWPQQTMLALWPESCVPYTRSPRRPEKVPSQITGMFRSVDGAGLLMGTAGRPIDDDKFENGILLVEKDHVLHWPYSKTRLVPYGEVTPFRGAVKFLDYPWGNYDLTEGRNLDPYDWHGINLGLMVCFDNVFAFVAREETLRGAEVLALLTNNSWYDLHSGIRQHCDQDVMRAVENRRPLARVSTTGWSHFVSDRGEIIAETGINGPDILTSWVEPGKSFSLYTVVGDLFSQLCVIGAVLLLLHALYNGRTENML